MKMTIKKKMEFLRDRFKYSADGKPDIYSFGEFKRGVTAEEIDDYLRVRSGKYHIKGLRKKYDKVFGVNTATMVTLTGSVACPDVDMAIRDTIHVTLFYRSDVQRFADLLFEGKPTFFD